MPPKLDKKYSPQLEKALKFMKSLIPTGPKSCRPVISTIGQFCNSGTSNQVYEFTGLLGCGQVVVGVLGETSGHARTNADAVSTLHRNTLRENEEVQRLRTGDTFVLTSDELQAYVEGMKRKKPNLELSLRPEASVVVVTVMYQIEGSLAEAMSQLSEDYLCQSSVSPLNNTVLKLVCQEMVGIPDGLVNSNNETFGEDGKITEERWIKHQSFSNLGTRDDLQVFPHAATAVLQQGLQRVVERLLQVMLLTNYFTQANNHVYYHNIIFILITISFPTQKHREKLTSFHHVDEADGKGAMPPSYKLLIKLKDLDMLPFLGIGIEDELHDVVGPPVVVDGDDQAQIQRALQLIYKKMPFLKSEPLWMISLLATHGGLGIHADEPFRDGPGHWIVSLSINGQGVTMNFLDFSIPVISFPLQHGTIAMFTGDARYRLLHRIDIHADGTTNTTPCYSHYYHHYHQPLLLRIPPTYTTTLLLLLTEFTFYSHVNHRIVQVWYQPSTLRQV